ncbi:DUF4145 domain-containing protein [Chloroflexota bacterium]
MTNQILLCSHCFNVTPHQLIVDGLVSKLFDEIEHDNGKTQKIIEPFYYALLKCGTCGDYSLLGDFEHLLPKSISGYPVLYPTSDTLDPSVPEKICKVYAEASRIRLKAPNAYAGQIRRALEFLCKNQNATGRILYEQLNSLVEKGTIPPTLGEMTTLIRMLGNIGVHAAEDEVSIWDAQLIDEFFRSIIEYVYIAPSKISRLKLRIDRRNSVQENNNEG